VDEVVHALVLLGIGSVILAVAASLGIAFGVAFGTHFLGLGAGLIIGIYLPRATVPAAPAANPCNRRTPR